MIDRTKFGLTPRELEVLGLVVDQLFTNREVAETLGIVEQVAKKHLEQIFLKVGLNHEGGLRKRIKLWRMFREPVDKLKCAAVFSDKEWTMMTMASEGAVNRDIAARLNMSEGVVKNSMKEIFDRAGVWTRLELAAWVDSHYRPEPSVVA